MTDYFNSTANDYIQPNLASCPGEADSYEFQFLPNQEAGVIFGSATVASMDLSDIAQELTGYTQQKKILEPGEVHFVTGLTKGLSYQTQLFYIDGSATYLSASDNYFMSVDLSVTYYKSFKYTTVNVHAVADLSTSIGIASALNTALAAKSINISAAYDPSYFSFTGATEGYYFNISSFDISIAVPDTSIRANKIFEDASSAVPYAKYPNTAMLGYLLKVTYPSSADTASDRYIKINHVPDYLTYYEASTGDASTFLKYRKAVDVGLSTTSTTTTLSAGDYLNYIDTNDFWEKVGVFRGWLSAPDPATNSLIENLITGFYVYNPQEFDVQIDYLIMV